MKREEPLYRPILWRALKTAWAHKELWIIAAFAGIAGSGTVVNDLIIQGNGALAFPETGGGAYSFVSFMKIYFGHLVAATPANAVVSFSLFAVLIFFACWAVITAQHVMLRSVHRATQGKTKLSLRELLNEAEHARLIRLFVITVFYKLLIVNTLLSATLMLRELHTEVFADAFFGIVFSFMVVALVFGFNVMEVFSLIFVAKSDDSVIDSMKDAWKAFSRHMSVALEMSAVLFGVNFFITILYILGTVIIAVPFMFLFGLAISFGSLGLISAVTILMVVALITFTIATAGFATTLTFAAWTELVYKLSKARSKVRARLHIHGARLFAAK